VSAIVTRPSFIRFSYPLRFDGSEFLERAAKIEQLRHSTDDGPVVVWKPLNPELRRTFGHFGEHINPKTRDDQTTALIWELAEKPTSPEHGIWSDHDWALQVKGRTVTQVKIQGAELFLFRTGIGFITLIARPSWDTPLDDWLNVQHYFRFSNGHREVRLAAIQRDESGEDHPYFPNFAGGLASTRDGKSGVARQLIDGLLVSKADILARNLWWTEPYLQGLLIPYAGLFIDHLPRSMVGETLYRIRNVFQPKQGLFPCDEDLSLEHPGLTPYAKDQWFLASLDGAAFVALDAPSKDEPGGEFSRNTLPSHLNGIYHLLFLVVHQQRLRLMDLSAAVASKWPVFEQNYPHGDPEGEFRKVRKDLMLFTARGLFSHIAPSEHHHCAYRRWQEIFEIDRLHREVSDEINVMHQFLEDQRRDQEDQRRYTERRLEEDHRKREERIEQDNRRVFERTGLLIAVIATIAVFPDLGLSLLNSRDVFGSSRSLTWAGAFLLLGFVILGALHLMNRRRASGEREQNGAVHEASNSGAR